MPHKHTRRDRDDSTYDLPPTQIARPLPVVAPKLARQAPKPGGSKAKGKQNGNDAGKDKGPEAPRGAKRKRGAADKKDDAPRAFKRLMAFADGKKFRSGLDDGVRDTAAKKKKKKSKAAEGDVAAETDNVQKEAPTIRPGEKLSDFARRVDAALPVMGLVNNKSGKNDPLGLKPTRTRKEKKMHKLYDEWRREEAAIQEKRREEAEEAEEAEMDDEGAGVKWKLDLQDQAGKGKKKKGKKGRSVWESTDADDEDPWEELKKKRGEKKAGLHDFAQAPPELKTKPKELFKVLGAGVDVGTIPKSAGSLKRREELQGVREEVVAAYRKMMQGRRERLEARVE
ncbi:hypothetical protein N8I77_009089 [Diaporthe amygdali]|uniref:Uncharacterized protein n=1 Tax=Phomopsis amygdali TaxID=1214568 RepID=A0AAD9W0J6_PHOAM|nr:hypothetical protein N8I77_009089 [Diaporthe amygdali]